MKGSRLRTPAALAGAACLVLIGVAATAKPPAWDKLIAKPSRFKMLKAFAQEAVLDKETGLVWERSPEPALRSWDQAMRLDCHNKVVGGRKGFRPPRIEELGSLIDPQRSAPALPEGHPFQGVQSDWFWTSSSRAANPLNAWRVNLLDGEADTIGKTNEFRIWCVRGGGGHDGVE